MIEILQFIFSSFWVWAGTVAMILAVAELIRALMSGFMWK